MKPKTKAILIGFLIPLSISIIGLFLINMDWYNDYNEYRSRNVIVLQKYVDGGRRSSNFWVVLQEKGGKQRIFDLIVQPATLYQCDEGKELSFNLREFDIQQRNILTILTLLSLVLLVTGAFLAIMIPICIYYEVFE